ncbi:Tll0287-like domain-containing protein [Candidatus Methylacidiphilum infernorum]|uniref:Cytochrome c family protein n=1 Tax=Methylacidiphilum infernorum (isolate V4) TaxID=481448 RepID=B3DUM9_METI4|nr:DUF3365 domain-containing protein [Candidatus Methylacidiphilum infernorum]ACD83032.1 Cytochrome c family protein [Methylacidiphilum infernorum V4]
MKRIQATIHGGAFLFLIMVFIPFFAARSQQEPVTSIASLEKRQSIEKIAEPVAQELQASLKNILETKIKELGPTGALEYCSLNALALTEKIKQKQGEKITLLKRTSDKVRNPLNKPDYAEKEALEIFLEAQRSREPLPANYIQKVEQDWTVKYRYYKPIFTGNLCLNCHGSPSQMSPELKEALKKRYPLDEATGYKQGDFRGLITVEVVLSKEE